MDPFRQMALLDTEVEKHGGKEVDIGKLKFSPARLRDGAGYYITLRE